MKLLVNVAGHETVDTFTTLDEALAELRRMKAGSIRFIVTYSPEEQEYLANRSRARDCFDDLVERYGQFCVYCETSKHLVVDHIRPLKRGGDSYIENLQLLCRSCNIRKGLRIIDYRPFPFYPDGRVCRHIPCGKWSPVTYRIKGVTGSADICYLCYPTLIARPDIRALNEPDELIFPEVA